MAQRLYQGTGRMYTTDELINECERVAWIAYAHCSEAFKAHDSDKYSRWFQAMNRVDDKAHQLRGNTTIGDLA